MSANGNISQRAAATALLAWWAEAGVDVTDAEATLAQSAKARGKAPPAPQPAAPALRSKPAAVAPPARSAPPQASLIPDAADPNAAEIAANCDTLDALQRAIASFDRHPLHALARNTVFARGDPEADVMLIGEAPGRDEDRLGQPFVGVSGKLLDRMFAAIDLSAGKGLYITNILNWRPPGNRTPNTEEIQLCLPFIHRHIALKAPKVLVFAGGVAAQSLLGVTTGIMRLRGRWSQYIPPEGGAPIPALPLYHPAFLLRRPEAKREAWADLLSLQDRLNP